MEISFWPAAGVFVHCDADAPSTVTLLPPLPPLPLLLLPPAADVALSNDAGLTSIVKLSYMTGICGATKDANPPNPVA